ncbi:hypothetical protein [Halomonas ramblicola]|uniref:hypothetical protein n=1 Tax=Halomonas ramblicola TaxID=747349 RepID=UPI0025B38F34|nr:hypothetical protein [Halomonas ramblicola]MDN3520082.1 hypothetical protein [Halomonas ramblicola]
MALFLLVFAVCLLIFGGMLAILLLSGTPRYRTEPQQLLDLFDRALESQVGETEWNTVMDYPIRHDDYLDGVRRRARRLMDEHGNHGRATRGKPLLDAEGREELKALRDHLASRQALHEQGGGNE